MAGEKGGYGLVYSEIMRSKQLTPEAKAIYAYLCSFAGSGDSCFPSVDLMQKELLMSSDRFYRHLRPLIAAGIVKKAQERNGNRWGRTVYTLNHSPDFQLSHNQHTENEAAEIACIENEVPHSLSAKDSHTNNTSINNTSINSISENNTLDHAVLELFNEARQAAKFKGRLRDHEAGKRLTGKLLAAGITREQVLSAAKDFVNISKHPSEIDLYRFDNFCRRRFHGFQGAFR